MMAILIFVGWMWCDWNWQVWSVWMSQLLTLQRIQGINRCFNSRKLCDKRHLPISIWNDFAASRNGQCKSSINSINSYRKNMRDTHTHIIVYIHTQQIKWCTERMNVYELKARFINNTTAKLEWNGIKATATAFHVIKKV